MTQVNLLIDGELINAEIRHNPEKLRAPFTLYMDGAPLVCQSKKVQARLERIFERNQAGALEGPRETAETKPEPGLTVVEDIGPGIDEDITERSATREIETAETKPETETEKKPGFFDGWFD